MGSSFSKMVQYCCEKKVMESSRYLDEQPTNLSRVSSPEDNYPYDVSYLLKIPEKALAHKGSVGGSMQSWTLKLKRPAPEEKFGIVQALTEDKSNHLQVTAVSETQLFSVLGEKDSLPVQPNDRIAAVNGVRGDMYSMRRELLEDEVELELFRFPEEFSVVLERLPGEPLGLIASISSEESQLMVKRLEEPSAVERHNKRVNQEGEYHLLVLPGLIIKAVEGENDPHKMLALLERAAKVEVLLRRGV